MFRYLTGFDSDVFDQFERMRRQMDQLFNDWPGASGIRSVSSGAFPAINVGSSAEQVDVYVFAAGMDPQSLDISLQQNLLTIASERKLITEEGANYYRKERYDGDLDRSADRSKKPVNCSSRQ